MARFTKLLYLDRADGYLRYGTKKGVDDYEVHTLWISPDDIDYIEDNDIICPIDSGSIDCYLVVLKRVISTIFQLSTAKLFVPKESFNFMEGEESKDD